LPIAGLASRYFKRYNELRQSFPTLHFLLPFDKPDFKRIDFWGTILYNLCIICKAREVYLDKLSDRDLFKKVAEDDERAFTLFVDRYKNRLYNFIFRIIPEKETGEDILQETFLRVYNQRKNYSPDYALSTWVYTIALNLVRSELRKRKLRRFMSLDFLKEEADIELPDNTNPEPGILKPLLEKAIKQLPGEYRLAFVLCDIERLPYSEIAEIMRVPVGTVKSRINRARSILREKLLPYKELNYELSKGFPQALCLY